MAYSLNHASRTAPTVGNVQRFAFGRNWLNYLGHFGGLHGDPQDQKRVEAATKALREKLPDLAGKRFLDVGCGSGLMSVAAQRLGAQVHSFDYDPDSAECTKRMRLYVGDTKQPWPIEQGSVLDREYLARLGTFDVVYSWGVLHHTGNLWQACENVATLVSPGGTLFIAIYNDQGWRS